MSHWTPPEDAILCAHYPYIGTACAVMLPGRSRSGCRNRAREIGVKHERKKPTKPVVSAWIKPAPRYPSIWHYAQGATA